MNASSIFDLFLQYIDYNYLLGILFAASSIYYIYKAFRRCPYSSAPAEKEQGIAALLTIVFLSVTVFNPLLYPHLSIVADGGTSYYRFIWIIPMVTISACFLTEFLFTLPVSISVLTAVIFCIVIALSGTSYLTKKNLTFPENKFTISRASLDISQFIHDDPDFDGEAVVLAPTEIMMELQAYDISIVPALPRNDYLEYGSGESFSEPLLSIVLEGAQRSTQYTAYYLFKLDVEYIVALTNFCLDDYLTTLDYPVYNRTGDYTVYKRSAEFNPFDWLN